MSLEQHDYQVILRITIVVTNAIGKLGAFQGALNLLKANPKEHTPHAVAQEVFDLGKSKVQLPNKIITP